MDELEAIVLSLCLAAFSLLLVSVINRQQTRRKLIVQRVSLLKRKIAELEEMTAELEPLLESTAIPRLMNEEIIDIIRAVQTLSPDNHFTDANLACAMERRENFADPSKKAPLYRIQNSDAAVVRCHYVINEAARIVRLRQAKGDMEVVEMEHYLSDLVWASLMVSVMTFIGQGHKAINRGDALRAYAFYRKAQQMAISNNHPHEHRHKIIMQIGEIMSNKRKSLTTDLMPESDLNPTRETIDLVQTENPEEL